MPTRVLVDVLDTRTFLMNSVWRTSFSSLFILKADPSGANVWNTCVRLYCALPWGWHGFMSDPIQEIFGMCPQQKPFSRQTPSLAVHNTDMRDFFVIKTN